MELVEGDDRRREPGERRNGLSDDDELTFD
jgi:hypothetical protein